MLPGQEVPAGPQTLVDGDHGERRSKACAAADECEAADALVVTGRAPDAHGQNATFERDHVAAERSTNRPYRRVCVTTPTFETVSSSLAYLPAPAHPPLRGIRSRYKRSQLVRYAGALAIPPRGTFAMTVIVSVKINDGIVMAADSAGSMSSGQVYAHANKIANLCRGLPIGAMSTGSGGIGNEFRRDPSQRFAAALHRTRTGACRLASRSGELHGGSGCRAAAVFPVR